MHVTHPVSIESSISSLQAGRFHILTYNPYFQLVKSIIQNYAIYRIKPKVLMIAFIVEKKTTENKFYEFICYYFLLLQ